jgi:hypothetical protein
LRANPGSFQCVHQEKLTQPLPMQVLSHTHSA